MDPVNPSDVVPAHWPCPRCKATLLAGSRFCHSCGLVLVGAPRRGLARAQRTFLVLGWAACFIAWTLLYIEVETVLVSGPVIMVLGAVLIVLSAILRLRRGAIV